MISLLLPAHAGAQQVGLRPVMHHPSMSKQVSSTEKFYGCDDTLPNVHTAPSPPKKTGQSGGPSMGPTSDESIGSGRVEGKSRQSAPRNWQSPSQMIERKTEPSPQNLIPRRFAVSVSVPIKRNNAGCDFYNEFSGCACDCSWCDLRRHGEERGAGRYGPMSRQQSITFVQRSCAHCREPFVPKEGGSFSGGASFCSGECKMSFAASNPAMARARASAAASRVAVAGVHDTKALAYRKVPAPNGGVRRPDGFEGGGGFKGGGMIVNKD